MRVAVRIGLVALVMGMAFALAAGPAFAAIDDVYLVSISTSGTQGTEDSYSPDVSADGRIVAFVSKASNLVAGDGSGYADVFVRDRVKNTTVRLMGLGGVEPNGAANSPSISDDGRYLAFQSAASNLVAGDTNGQSDVFLYDIVNGVTSKVSNGLGGAAATSGSYRPRVSGNGKAVAYESSADNLVANDTNGMSDVFLYDVATGATLRVSALNGTQGNDDSYSCAVSSDGRYVTFSTYARNFGQLDLNDAPDVWRWDRSTGALVPVSMSPAGALASDSSSYSEMSADGSFVVFRSYADDVVLGDSNGYADVFVRDMVSGSTQRVSVSTSGIEGNDDSFTETAISSDGRYVAFYSNASNLVTGDTNDAGDLFIRDRQSNTTIRTSISSTGAQGNYYSAYPNLAASGRFLVFEGSASTLVPNDTNGFTDVFLKQLSTEPSELALTASTTTPAYDSAVILAGVLKKGIVDGPPIVGAGVTLQKLSGSAWTDVMTATTGADGGVSFTATPRTRTTYRLSYAGAVKAYDSIASAAVEIAPHPKVGTPVAPKTVKKSRSFSVYGSLKPKHAKGTKPVRIYKFKHVKVKGKWTWKPSGYVKAKAYNYKGYTRYKVSMRLTSKGTWRLRAYTPADSLHSQIWSAKYDTVKVK